MQSGFWWASASAFHFGGQMTYTSDLHFPLALGSVHAPQLMQATSGIKYKNCNNIWRFLTNPDLHTYKGGETVSCRMQSWLDADGTASHTGCRTMTSSAWANEWWKMHSTCTLDNERWVCPMDSKDSSAALKLCFNPALYYEIGMSISSMAMETAPRTARSLARSPFL